MRQRQVGVRSASHLAGALLLVLSSGSCARQPAARSTQTLAMRMTTASGPFDVEMSPQPAQEGTGGSTLGRFVLSKQYHGDLEATSEGQMLTAGTDVKGSAAYVAVERVTGTLGGRRGSFSLQHTGVMNRGAPALTITVVPDSGTDELTGLAGTMSIDIASDGKHSYRFEYTLPDGTSS